MNDIEKRIEEIREASCYYGGEARGYQIHLSEARKARHIHLLEEEVRRLLACEELR